MFWIGLILLIIGLLCLKFLPVKRVQVQRATYGQEAKYEDISLKPFAWIPIGLALLFIILACFTVVGTRNVGVEKFFSATTGTNYSPGLHFKPPWNGVQDIDATIQPEEYNTDHPIKVKIGDQGEAEVALAYRWRINPDGADEVYKDYRQFDDINLAVRKALVTTNIKAALNEELGTYNPLQDVVINADMTPEAISKVTIPPIPFEQLNKDVKANVEDKIADLGDLIDIQSVTISYLKLPEGTQKKINEFNAKVQKSKNTLIDISIKKAEASANKELASSVNNSPNVLVSKCLDSLAEGEFTAPAGFPSVIPQAR
jgi:regulator of protease activity HflC (stomatin/prohibitin superfamily)